jgi:hypothetical protein
MAWTKRKIILNSILEIHVKMYFELNRRLTQNNLFLSGDKSYDQWSYKEDESYGP